MSELSKESKERIKELRQTAQTLLQYADALEDGKITVVRPGAPGIVHMFPGSIKPQLVQPKESTPAEVRVTRCAHNLDVIAIYLTFAHCPISCCAYAVGRCRGVVAESYALRC